MFGRLGLKVSLEVTQVLWVGQQKKELDTLLERRNNSRATAVYTGVSSVHE